MPILQKRINKNTFGEVLERANSRLAGWKGRVLSLAGRITLTKAVLSSLPVHSMSTILLPKSTLNALDKISRNFIWNSSLETRKQHLVSWKAICLPKEEGGLGIRKAEQMNKTLIAKIGWRLLFDVKSLWACVLRSKYRVGEENWIANKSSWSSTWRSIAVGLKEVVIPNLRWVIGDGAQIKFWQDIWMGETPLQEFVTGVLTPDCLQLRVKDLWIEGVGWDLHRLEPLLPRYVQLELRAVMVDSVTGSRDRVAWGASNDGIFSVSSAYKAVTRDVSPRPNVACMFQRVWRAVLPERVRVFLWLVLRQVIMTNVERQRRHLGDSGICQVCKGGEETIIHILRDCPAISGVWSRLVLPRQRGCFFSQTLLEWVYSNLNNTDESYGSSWATLFGMVVWWSWKWRCGNIFGENGKCRDRVRFVKDIAREVHTAHKSVTVTEAEAGRVIRQIAWVPPPRDWVRLNTDGASRGNPGLATAGGVLRDAEGRWLGGFAFNIGVCSAPVAEVWGVYYGLCLAWDRRIPRLELVVDSVMVVEFLKKGISESHPLSPLVRMCYDFISKDWIVHVSHGYREANRLADGLANYAFDQPLGVVLFDVCPIFVSPILDEDANGTAFPRRVRL